MKLYLSGPMTGYLNHNKEAFDAVAAVLRQGGHVVVSPVELDHTSGLDINGDGWEVDDDKYEELMARDLEQVDDPSVDAIVFLPGWEKSGGAGREGIRALKARKRLYQWDPVWGTLANLTALQFIDAHTTERLRPQPQEA